MADQNGYNAEEFGKVKQKVFDTAEIVMKINDKMDKQPCQKHSQILDTIGKTIDKLHDKISLDKKDVYETLDKKVGVNLFWKVVGIIMMLVLSISGWLYAHIQNTGGG